LKDFLDVLDDFPLLKEKMFFLKEKALFSKEFAPFDISCISCCSKEHLLSDCPRVIIKRYIKIRGFWPWK